MVYDKLQKLIIITYVLTLCAFTISPFLVLGALLDVFFYERVTYYETNKIILVLEIIPFLIACIYSVEFYVSKLGELKKSLKER